MGQRLMLRPQEAPRTQTTTALIGWTQRHKRGATTAGMRHIKVAHGAPHPRHTAPSCLVGVTDMAGYARVCVPRIAQQCSETPQITVGETTTSPYRVRRRARLSSELFADAGPKHRALTHMSTLPV